jgi:UDP-N-acetylglucosamine transferase subunit ALG13
MWAEGQIYGGGYLILATVGTHYQQFDRLVKGADHLALVLVERVIIQRGNSNYLPLHAEHFQWTSSQQMETLTRESRLVISQASAGSIIFTIKHCKPLILVPRVKRYGENHDDHQQQLARMFASKGRAVIVDDPDASTLRGAIAKAEQQINRSPGPKKLQRALRQQLDDWFGVDLVGDQLPD